VIIEQHANPIGGVELLQEGDELAAAVALSDGMVDNTSHGVYSGREGHGACIRLPRLGGKTAAGGPDLGRTRYWQIAYRPDYP
jgi:hypothetical protein